MPRRRSVAPLVHTRLAAILPALAAALLLSLPAARAADFIDAAGRHVALPSRIGRVLPAERNAEVMLFVMAPDKLVGLSRVSMAKRPTRAVLGWRPRTVPESMAQTARRLRPDLILDAGTVTPDRAAFADRVTAETGIPYLLVDDSFARVSRTMRSIGAILGVDERRIRDLFMWAEHAVAGVRGRLLIRAANGRPRVYYALGADGLTTALPGSPAGAALDEVGAINVAAPLGRGTELRVGAAELAAWDPEIIIAEGSSPYAAIRRNPALRRLSAVRHHRVYLEPTQPFGWIEDPSGVNRLIGLYWLSTLFYPDETQEDLRSVTCEFYDKFYRIKLTNARLEAMVRAAGAPPVTAPSPVGEPLTGLGSAPPSQSPSTPSSGAAPGAVAGLPGMPGAGPGEACSLPGGNAAPIDLTSPTPAPGASPGGLPLAPGVPPPGRRGRPSAMLNQPGAAPGGPNAASAGDPAPSQGGLDIAADKDGNVTVDGEIVPADQLPAAIARARARRQARGIPYGSTAPEGRAGVAYQYQTRP